MLDRITDWLEGGSLYVALLVAWVAMLGSLYFSEVSHYIPCTFCWYQRILMYPLTVLIAVGLLRRDRHLPLLVLPFSVIGIGVASYHYLLQKTDLFTNVTTCQVGVPCSGIWINWLGFITIPFLSLSAFIIITFMTIIAWQAGLPVEPEWDEEAGAGRPWIPIIAIIAVVSALFFIIGQTNRASADAHVGAGDHDNATAEGFPVLETGAFMTIDGTPVDPQSIEVGQRLYGEVCAPCHGAAGEGVPTVGTALTESTMLREEVEAEVLTYIRTGSAVGDAGNSSGVAMPASGGRPDLSDDELLSVIRYLRTLVDQGRNQ